MIKRFFQKFSKITSRGVKQMARDARDVSKKDLSKKEQELLKEQQSAMKPTLAPGANAFTKREYAQEELYIRKMEQEKRETKDVKEKDTER